MSPENSDQLVATAIRATSAWVAVLHEEDLLGWADRFSSVLGLLQAGKYADAIEMTNSFSFTGMGSLSDIYANNQPEFDRSWSACIASIKALGQWSSQGCSECRKAILQGSDPQILTQLGVSKYHQSTLLQCKVCSAFWEECERYSHEVSSDEARKFFDFDRQA